MGMKLPFVAVSDEMGLVLWVKITHSSNGGRSNPLAVSTVGQHTACIVSIGGERYEMTAGGMFKGDLS
jgi:hypothetical protein